ncbi:hypothetical protein [Candidatus Berkiella aquae]|uniref:Uncharacterized protein n=1 Tax=Candidatus Berkiella aquae TaxID=295108 RepID=A0A0Q9YVL2_9GAMM|nr:hypothetical protein [Candidatus Berkiella aquae]MCS5710545.1 hypothetical protein [Candidatus Berkiella aquae]
MTTKGVVPNLDSKYTMEERQTFFEIVKANSDGNHTLMGTLVEKLDSGQRERFKEYFADLKIVQAHDQELHSKMVSYKTQYEQHMTRVAELDVKIADLERKEKLVFSQGAKQTASKQMDIPKGTAIAVASKKKVKPGKSGSSQNCVVM